jgi:hypothetical protein
MWNYRNNITTSQYDWIFYCICKIRNVWFVVILDLKWRVANDDDEWDDRFRADTRLGHTEYKRWVIQIEICIVTLTLIHWNTTTIRLLCYHHFQKTMLDTAWWKLAPQNIAPFVCLLLHNTIKLIWARKSFKSLKKITKISNKTPKMVGSENGTTTVAMTGILRRCLICMLFELFWPDIDLFFEFTIILCLFTIILCLFTVILCLFTIILNENNGDIKALLIGILINR